MIASLLLGLADVLIFFFQALFWLIILSSVISFVDADPSNPVVRAIRGLTEPLYRPFRKFTSKIAGPFDLSPMIVIMIVIFLQTSIPHYLVKLARSLE